MALQVLSKRRTLANPNLIKLFSSSAEPNAGDETGQPRSSFVDYFKDVKSHLTNPENHSNSNPRQSSSLHRLGRSPISDSPSSPPRNAPSFEEIRKNLASFPRRSGAAENPTPPPQKFGFSGEIRKRFTLSLNRSAAAASPEFPAGTRGSEKLPALVFGKELKESSAAATEVENRRAYGYEELGEKLRKLRPEMRKSKGEWFSLEELSGRLTRVWEEEEKNLVSDIASGKDLIGGMKRALETIGAGEKSQAPKMFSLSDFSAAPVNMMELLPPKEHLLETYNHPDNMSAAEKMKIELGKVRDEFKMSESDCGSTRVQVALLTTKIKYLSSSLHKKDKHSRKGLVQMVHKRRKLLKYLRRTDWESYCFVLDKLGLRDVTKYKS